MKPSSRADGALGGEALEGESGGAGVLGKFSWGSGGF